MSKTIIKAFTDKAGPSIGVTDLEMTGTLTTTGVNFGEQTLANYKEGTWTPTTSGSPTNLSGSATYNNARYTRIGRMVIGTIDSITGFSYTGSTSGADTFLNIDISDLFTIVGDPGPNAQIFGTCSIGTSGAFLAAHGFDPGSGDNFAVEWQQHTSATSSLTLRGIHFWYYL